MRAVGCTQKRNAGSWLLPAPVTAAELQITKLHSHSQSFPAAHPESSAGQLGRDTARLGCSASCSLSCELFNKTHCTPCPAPALYSPSLPRDLLTAETTSPSARGCSGPFSIFLRFLVLTTIGYCYFPTLLIPV